jgi:diadenosine tetraphosphate (Ap4A) HIT family hydrolase
VRDATRFGLLDDRAMERRRTRTFPFEEYLHRVRTGPCFVCAILAGHPDYPHDDVYEDDDTIAFLVRWPTLLGHVLVAPKTHVESWVEGMSEDEFARFQRTVHRVATAVAATLPTERIYAMSLGSQQGNSHLHWHVAPLPPGVPYEQQQFYALMSEHGILDVTADSQAALAAAIHANIRRD